jgi:hypothetical protein
MTDRVVELWLLPYQWEQGNSNVDPMHACELYNDVRHLRFAPAPVSYALRPSQ